MNKKTLGPGITFFPQPATWIVSVDKEGEIDVMTASWVSMVSKTPPTIALSLHHGRQTYANIQQSGVFTVNIIPSTQVVAGDYCGLISGRDVDKLATTDLTPVAALHVAAPILAESPLNLECRVINTVVIGEYRLILGEVLEIHIAAAACHDHGYDAAVIDPLVYLGGIREYWGLGEKVGTAYSIGKELLPK
ncbi:MAG: flavin reductase family protein [Desulfuromonadales bacterium]|nr:flavin reductase family protein [Desulfuromonadales bacterium]